MITRPVRPGRLADALGDVQGDRHRSALPLIADLALAARELGEQAEDEREKVDGALVDVEVFVREEAHE